MIIVIVVDGKDFVIVIDFYGDDTVVITPRREIIAKNVLRIFRKGEGINNGDNQRKIASIRFNLVLDFSLLKEY